MGENEGRQFAAESDRIGDKGDPIHMSHLVFRSPQCGKVEGFESHARREGARQSVCRESYEPDTAEARGMENLVGGADARILEKIAERLGRSKEGVLGLTV